MARGLAGSRTDGRVGIAGLPIFTLRRLADLIATAPIATGGRRPITGPILVGGIRGEVARRPGLFAPVADHPRTAQALADASSDLRLLDPTALERVASINRVSGVVVSIHEGVRGSSCRGDSARMNAPSSPPWPGAGSVVGIPDCQPAGRRQLLRQQFEAGRSRSRALRLDVLHVRVSPAAPRRHGLRPPIRGSGIENRLSWSSRRHCARPSPPRPSPNARSASQPEPSRPVC